MRDGEGLWRRLGPQTLATLVRSYGADRFDLCEDAVQDALLDAHRQWAARPPDDPQAWLVTTARRRYVDRVRSEQRRRDREERVALLEEPLAHTALHSDDALLLLQLCCHPQLPRSGQVALTLRAVAGLTTAQIANAYQLPDATIAQRITRAKRRLMEAGAAFPRPEGPGERLAPVLDVLYVMFTEAHHTTSGAPARDADLAGEAIHLARLLRQAVPDSTEVAGLLALMLLTEARQPARASALGRLVPLDEQDRSLWNTMLIEEGLELLDLVTPGATPGPYLVQACIAALHAQARDTESTDWAEIRVLYVLLEHLTEGRNPTVTLNRIVAEAMVEGYDHGLARLEELAASHPHLARLDAVRAHLLERAGRTDEAIDAYRRAIAATLNVAEQRHLRDRLLRLRPGAAGAAGRADTSPDSTVIHAVAEA
jgi:RNA polymerase sigma factor (sigma-70 family)